MEYNEGFTVGSVDKENARYIDSIKGRIEKLKEAFRTLVTTTITTDMFKNFISGTTNVVNGINNIISACDEMGVATPVVFGALAGVFSTIRQKATQAEQATQNITNQTGNVKKFGESFKESFSGSFVSKFIDGLKAIPGKFNEIKTNVQNTTGVVNKCKVAFQSLGSGAVLGRLGSLAGTVVATAGNMFLMMGISIAVSKVFEALSNWINEADNKLEKHTENIENYQSEIKQLTQTKDSVQEIAEEYDELAKKTEKTSEEQERYNELRKELADILGEDYVLGYDDEGNPILKMTGDVQDLIDELDNAIQRKNTLLAAEKKSQSRDAIDWLNGYDIKEGTKRNEYDDKAIKESQKVIERQKSYLLNLTRANGKLDNSSGEDYEKNLQKTKDYLAEYADAIEEGAIKAQTEWSRVEENVQKVRDGITADLTTDINFQGLSDEIKNFGYNFSSMLDFSELDNTQVMAFTNGIKDALSDDEIDSILIKYQDLRTELNKSWDYESYEKSVSDLIPELSKLWGVSEEVAQSMVATPSYMKEAKSVLDEYLMSFGKREHMQRFDKETSDLIARYQAFSDAYSILSNMDHFEVNGEIQFDINTIESLKSIQNMPDEVNSLIDDMLKDDKITEKEHKLLAKLSLAYQESDVAQRESQLKEAQEMVDELFPNGEYNLGDITVDANFELDKSTQKKINDKFDELKDVFNGRDEIVKIIKANITNADQVQLFADIIKNLNATPEETNKFIKANIENLSQMESYEGVVNYLLNHPEIANEFSIKVIGEDTINTIKTSLDELMQTDKEKEVSVKMVESLKEGNINQFNELLASLPEEKRVEVVASVTDALGKIDTVDAKKIKDKIIEFKENGFKIVIEKEKEVDKNAGNKKKEVKVTNPGGKETNDNLKDINKNAKDKTITITTILKTIGGKLSEASEGMGKLYGRNSISTFSGVSSDPIETETMSMQSNEPMTTSLDTPNELSSNDIAMRTNATKSFGDIGLLSTRDTKINITKTSVNKALEYSIELFQELQNQISKVNNKLDLLNTKSENAIGTNKIEYLKQQNALYEEQQRLQKKLYDNSQKEKDYLKESLKSYGFKFDSQGNLTQYEETLLAMEDKAKKLNEAVEKASEKSNNSVSNSTKKAVKKVKYNMEGLSEAQKNTFKNLSDADKKKLFGDNRVIETTTYKTTSSKKKSSSNSSTSDAASKAADEYNEKLEKAKKLADEYLQLQYTDIPNAEKEWYELANSIKENNDEIEKLTREDKLYKFANRITQINNELEISANKLDIIDAKLTNAYGSDEITLTKQRLELLNEQLEKQQDIMEQINNQIPIYQEDLAKYGATFDNEGNISNLDSFLNSFQNSEDKEKIQDLVDEYMDIIINELPNVQKEYEDLKNDIISVYEDSLDKTKDIEKEITDMIESELDKRKDAIKKQTDNELDLIDKRKKAYQDARDEDDYQKDLKEQQDKIADLNKQIELARKDNSLNGQSKLEKLLEELDEENKALNEKIQDRTDKMVEEMYDNESEKLQEKSDKMIEDLENEFTDKKIAEIVQQTLTTGFYTDLDGNIKSLQDALVNFAEESGDALGITGDLIKNQLVGNMEAACNYAKNYKDIMDSLALKSYGNIDYVKGIQNTGDTKNINIGDTIINVNGNADDKTVDSIKKEIDSYMQNIINKI